MPSAYNVDDNVLAISKDFDLDATEVKLKALNSLHAGKIKSLLSNISKLQKENASIKKSLKEDANLKSLSKASHSLGEQDVILSCMMSHIRTSSGEKEIKHLINQALNPPGGPRIMRPPTRVELQIENQSVRQLKLEKENLRSKLKAAHDEKAKLRVDIAKHEAAKDSGSLEFAAAIDELRQIIDEKNTEVSALQSDMQAMEQVRKQDLNTIAQFQQNQIMKIEENSLASQSVKMAEQRVVSLEERINFLLSSHQDILAEFEKEAEKSEEEHLERHKTHQETIATLEVEKEALEAEKQQLVKKVGDLELEISRGENILHAERRKSQAQISETVSTHKRRNSQLALQLQHMQNARASQDEEELRAQNAFLEQQNKGLQEELSRVQSIEDVQTVIVQPTRKRSETLFADLPNQSQETDQDFNKTEIENQISAVQQQFESEHEKLEQEMSDHRRDNIEHEQSQQQLQKDLQDLQIQHTNLGEQYESMKCELEKAQLELAASLELVQEQQQKLAQLEEEEVWSVSGASDWNGSFFSEIQSLKQKLAARDAKIVELESGITQPSAESSDSGHHDEIIQLMNQIKYLNKENDDLRNLVRAHKIAELPKKEKKAAGCCSSPRKGWFGRKR